MTLYEIDQRIMSLADPDTGELPDFEAFQQLEMERREKIEGVILWYKDLLAQAKAIKEENDKLTQRRQAVERKADGLLAYIDRALNGEKFSTSRCTVSYRTSKALEVDDLDQAADWLDENGYLDLVVHAAPKLDKRAVKELVKQGFKVPGVELVEKRSIQVR